MAGAVTMADAAGAVAIAETTERGATRVEVMEAADTRDGKASAADTAMATQVDVASAADGALAVVDAASEAAPHSAAARVALVAAGTASAEADVASVAEADVASVAEDTARAADTALVVEAMAVGGTAGAGNVPS